MIKKLIALFEKKNGKVSHAVYLWAYEYIREMMGQPAAEAFCRVIDNDVHGYYITGDTGYPGSSEIKTFTVDEVWQMMIEAR